MVNQNHTLEYPFKWLSLLLLVSNLFSQEINLQTLLNEMVNRETLANFPTPIYTSKQASSYNRASITPNEPNGWFANQDWSRFIRKESNSGRDEWVMMESSLPGVITRFWMGNPAPTQPNRGNIRIYFDGSSTPSLEMPIEDFLNGGLTGPPLSAVKEIGRNFYLPIPYAQSCKVTYDLGYYWEQGQNREDRAFYIINYREYPEGSSVKTFTTGDLTTYKSTLDNVQQILLTPSLTLSNPIKIISNLSKNLSATGDTLTNSLYGTGAVCQLSIQLTSTDMEIALRNTYLTISFDGVETVEAPVGDFFGSGLGLNPYKGWFREVSANGMMTSYWTMPFQKTAEIILENRGNISVTANIDNVSTCPHNWNKSTMYFHSSWRQENQIASNPRSDWNYVKINGKGVYVGDVLAMYNPIRGWWGEGDEKIFVDNMTFPAHFGTGTEDYYGYSFGDQGGFFEAPFHAQPRAEGNPGPGHITNTRTRSLDAIPFEQFIDVNMEIWTWSDIQVDYSAATYWYQMIDSLVGVNPYELNFDYKITRNKSVDYKIYSLEGQLLRSLPYTKNFYWNQHDDKGQKVSQGIYIVRRSDGFEYFTVFVTE